MSPLRKISDMIPARVALALITATGTMTMYVIRINLSVAIVAMAYTPTTVNTTSGQQANTIVPYCKKLAQEQQALMSPQDVLKKELIPDLEGTSRSLNDSLGGDGFRNITEVNINKNEDKLELTSEQRGAVLGAFFYGYFTTAIVGGRLAEVYGTKHVLGGSMFVSALLSLLTPVAARTHYAALIVLRVIIGMAQGVCYPSLHAMVARWIPPLEKSRFTAFTYIASSVGIVITLPLCGIIIDAIGWPSVFYVSGSITLLWVCIWWGLMHNSPEEHPRISREERTYILEAINSGTKHNKPKSIPWKQMLTSRPVWAITCAHMGNMFGLNLLVTQLPTFMSSVLGFSIKSNGALSSLPFLCRYFGGNSISWIADWLLTKKYISERFSRRLFTAIGLCVPGMMLASAGYVGCNSSAAVALLCIGSAFNGATVSGYLPNQHEIAPNLAGTMLGISNTFAFGVGMLAPVIVGFMTPDQTAQQWQGAFWVAAGVYATTCLIYTIFTTSDLQPWNFDQSDQGHPDEEEAIFLKNNKNEQIIAQIPKKNEHHRP